VISAADIWRALGFGILVGLAAIGMGTVWYWLFSMLSCRAPA
jgi:hypothetical protein